MSKVFHLDYRAPRHKRKKKKGPAGEKGVPFHFNLINIPSTACFWPNLQVKETIGCNALGPAKLFLVNTKEMTNLYLATSGRWFRFICLYSEWIWILSPISSITASTEPRTQTNWVKAIVLNWGWFCPPGDIWQCLGTFVFVSTGRGSTTGTEWIEASDAKYLPIPRTAPHNKKLSSVEWQ